MQNQTVTNMMAVLILIMFSLKVKSQTSDSILGNWKDAGHPDKQIEITYQNGRLTGKSINAAKAKENGKTVLKDLIWSDTSKSYKGILINPDDGDEFNIEIKMIGTDKFRFTAGKFIFSRTFTFNRIPQ